MGVTDIRRDLDHLLGDVHVALVIATDLGNHLDFVSHGLKPFPAA